MTNWIPASEDEFERRLAVAREGVLVHTADLWRAVEGFEPILEELYCGAADREEKFVRLRLVRSPVFLSKKLS